MNRTHTEGAGTMTEMAVATMGSRGDLRVQAELTEELIERFYRFIDVRPQTVQTYRRALKPFFMYLGERGITRPSREDVISYRNTIQGTLKASTVQSYMTSVRLFFRWLAQEGLYLNVADHVESVKLSRDHRKDCFNEGQVREILQGVDRSTETGSRNYAILALMTTAGLRCIEITRANVEDIRNTSKGPVLYIQGKGRDEKGEYVEISEPVRKAIVAYLSTRGRLDGKAPLFSSASDRNNGSRLTTRTVSGLVKDHLRRSGYDSERLTAHSLRHTAAMTYLKNGEKIEQVQQMLRHSDIRTTMIYLNHLKREENTCVATATRAIFGE